MIVISSAVHPVVLLWLQLGKEGSLRLSIENIDKKVKRASFMEVVECFRPFAFAAAMAIHTKMEW